MNINTGGTHYTNFRFATLPAVLHWDYFWLEVVRDGVFTEHPGAVGVLL